MPQKASLTKVKGIGKTIAERLIANGIDSLDKLAIASADELGKIRGLQSTDLPEIIAQAKELALAEKLNDETLAALMVDTSRLKDEVETLVHHIRERFADEGDLGDKHKILRKEISRTLASLERVEAALSSQLRRLGKGLAKADAKISQVTDSNVDDVLSGLKKARKKIESAVD